MPTNLAAYDEKIATYVTTQEMNSKEYATKAVLWPIRWV